MPFPLPQIFYNKMSDIVYTICLPGQTARNPHACKLKRKEERQEKATVRVSIWEDTRRVFPGQSRFQGGPGLRGSIPVAETG